MIAIILRGISYDDNYICKRDNRTFTIDYRRSIDNYLENIINPLKKINKEIHFFIITNKHLYSNDLINTFKPKRYILLEENIVKKSERVYSPIAERCRDGLYLVRDYMAEECIEYEWIIMTRFDLKFHKPLTTYDWDEKCINVGLRCKFQKNICDNLHILKPSLLSFLIECFDKVLNNKISCTHQIYIGNMNKFNLLSKKISGVMFNPVYNIIKRIKQ